MNRFERFELCMRHQTPDRPPLDVGGTSLTGLRPQCQQRLKELLGFYGEAAATCNGVDERIRQWAGADFRSVGGIVNLPGVHERQVSGTCRIDCWGIRTELISGEWQITGHPLQGATRQDLEAFRWPEPRVDERELARWEQDAKRLHADNRYVIIGEHPVFGIMELGCWMCGYDDFLLRLAGDPDFVRSFFDRVLAIQLAVIEQYYTVLGPYLRLTTSGDDFGMQGGPFMSPETFRALIMPYFSARIARTKDLAGCYYWHHTCGSVGKLIDGLIACGVDILNPVQTSAAGMEPRNLKAAFGKRIVFWGGVDVQQFLRQATPREVRMEILSLAGILGADGGYVMAPAHVIQDDIPPENIVAWVEAVNGISSG